MAMDRWDPVLVAGRGRGHPSGPKWQWDPSVSVTARLTGGPGVEVKGRGRQLGPRGIKRNLDFSISFL
jgi:hypothetical protein